MLSSLLFLPRPCSPLTFCEEPVQGGKGLRPCTGGGIPIEGICKVSAWMPEQEKANVSQDSSLQSLIQWAGTSVKRLSSRLLANSGSAAADVAAFALPAVVRMPSPCSSPQDRQNPHLHHAVRRQSRGLIRSPQQGHERQRLQVRQLQILAEREGLQ